MKLAFLLLVFFFGCGEPPATESPATESPATESLAETPVVESPPKAVKPWGGLEVKTRGVPLKDATEVVVLLHGYGAAGDDLVPFADRLAADGRAFVFPAAPVKLDSGGRAWVTQQSELGPTLTSLKNLIAYVHDENSDAEISVGGFSQGASMSSMLIGSSTPLGNVILFSPGMFRGDIASATDESPAVYISHGTQDKVLPFSDAEKLKQKLTDAGYEVKLSSFKGGHTIPAKAIKEAKAQLDK